MLVDACVARSFGVVGWTRHLITACGGRILIADGVHGENPEDPSEIRGIRAALAREANEAPPGSGLASRALSAVVGLDELLRLGPPDLVIVTPTDEEFALAVRLQSRDAADREWRLTLGAHARRLDAGEAVSIAIAATRSLGFASDDEDALRIWSAITGTVAIRTRDVLRYLVDARVVEEAEARQVYKTLQTDDLHALGGPDW